MAKKYKNLDNNLKNMNLEDCGDFDAEEVSDERGVNKFHKNDGTEFHKRNKIKVRKPKPDFFDDGL